MIFKFTLLEQLLSAYFHQEWSLDHESADDVIMFYKNDVDLGTVELLKKQIDALISLNLTEDTLQDVLFNQMECGYNYLYEWNSSVDWLRHIYAQLS